jgi:hypothetical protein
MKDLSDREKVLAKCRQAAVRGDRDPTVQALREKVEAAKRALEAEKKQLRPNLVRELRETGRREIQAQGVALRSRVTMLRKMEEDLLKDVSRCEQDSRTINKGSIDLEPALWTFRRVAGVEPTNNAAEQALRPAVLKRKRSLGCYSEDGCRFVERLFSVTHTLRLRQRPILDYLVGALVAHRHGLPAPQLPAAA